MNRGENLNNDIVLNTSDLLYSLLPPDNLQHSVCACTQGG